MDGRQKHKYILLLIILFLFTKGSVAADSVTGSEKVKMLVKQCWSLREKNPDSALRLAQDGIRLGDSLGFFDEHDQFYGYSGVILMHYKSNVADAVPFLQKAMEYAIKTNDSVVIAFTYNNLGDAYYLTGNGPLALEYARISLKYFNKLKHASGIAYGYINLGLLYRFQKSYDSSLYYLNKAIAVRRTINDKLGIASAHLELARTYLEQGDIENSDKFYEESLKLHQEIDNKSWMAQSLNGLAKTSYLKGDYKDALLKYRQSLELNSQRNHRYAMVRDQLGMALVYSKTGDLNKGDSVLQAALAISKQIGLPTLLLDTYETLALYYLNAKDFNASKNSLSEFLFVYDSVYILHQHATMQDLQNHLRINLQMEQMNMEIKAHRTRLLFLLIVIFLLVLLVLGLILQYIEKRKTNTKLRLMNESKDKLFSVISHDLSSPFNSLLGLSEMLKDNVEQGDFTELPFYAQNIHQAASDSYGLLVNLLEWSRSQRGKLSFLPEQQKLLPLLSEVLDLLSPMSNKKQIKLMVDISPETEVYADTSQISSVFRNLISNSIKFSFPKGIISIEAHENEKVSSISIIDRGLGMTATKQQELFLLKGASSSPGTENEIGTGLGLIICKDFIDLHKGTIKVKSQPGKGSTFTVNIPKK
jgi:signal transduction histidine kinase